MAIIESFPVEVNWHQRSTPSPFLFAIILNESSKSIRESIFWCVLFANDIVQCEARESEDNLEGKGLRISCSKTKYLRCNFDGGRASGRYSSDHWRRCCRVNDQV